LPDSVLHGLARLFRLAALVGEKAFGLRVQAVGPLADLIRSGAITR
jgi:hypothetical protein